MSELYQRFIESMKIDYMKWHEGIGYDLEALRQLPPVEQAKAEKMLLSHGVGDWRDVEALDVLGTKDAITALKKALKSKRFEVRISAAEHLAKSEHITPAEVERVLVETIPEVTILNGLSFTFRLAEQYPTEAVRRAVLKNAMHGADDARVLSAALAEFLFGAARSSFDMHRRELYLRFNEKNPAVRREAYLELCRNVGIDPETL